MVLHSTATAASSLNGSTRRSLLPAVIVLCFSTGAALHAEPFVAAAAELNLYQGVVCVVLALATLFYWAILSVHFFIAHDEGEEPRVLLGRTRSSTAAALQTSSASRDPRLLFTVLCFVMSVLAQVEPLVEAAADLRIHPGVVACFAVSVAAFFNWAVLSLNLHVARGAAERELEKLPLPRQAAFAARSPRLARLALLVLAALVSASWFIEPFLVAVAELQLHGDVVIVVVLSFAALFNLCVHFFRSFFLPDPPSAFTAAAQGHGVGEITTAVIGIAIATAACVVGAVGSACNVFAPARG